VENIAAMHYRVERIESDLLTNYRRVAYQAAASPFAATSLVRPAAPDPNRPLVMQEADEEEIRRTSQADIVRILDREGNVVWFQEFRFRQSGVRRQTEITDDLMKLDAAAFRQKYAIIPERPLAAEAGQAPGGGDLWGAWGARVRQSEGGAEWNGPGNESGNDPGWGDWSQR
jgi:hypothetical protein